MEVKLPQSILGMGTTRNIMREIFEYGRMRAKEIGAENVFDYSLGNPSVPAPACVNSLIAELLSGEESAAVHSYTSAQGDPANRELLAQSLNRRFNAGARADDFYMTVGAAAALTITFHALTVPEDGDEFIALAPFFTEYRIFIDGAGAKTVVVPPNYETFEPDLAAFEAAVSPRTKGVVVNTPNNPSGVVYSRETLAAMADILRRKEREYGRPIYLITDEPYRELVFTGHSASWVPDIYDDTIVCYSWSKSLSIPGERIGYIFLPQKAASHDALYACICGAGRRLGYVNPPSLFQRVAVRCDGETADISVYERNAKILCKGLRECGFTFVEPGGSFYLLLKSPAPDAAEFCKKAQEFELLLAPTDTFCLPGYVRIAFCVQTEKVERSLPAFRRLAESYGLC